MNLTDKIKTYFTVTGKTYPNYESALLFLITEAIEALDDETEMGDVLMMYKIAEDRCQEEPDYELEAKMRHKVPTIDLPCDIDAIVNGKASWKRNNKKERDLDKEISYLIRLLEAYQMENQNQIHLNQEVEYVRQYNR